MVTKWKTQRKLMSLKFTNAVKMIPSLTKRRC